MSASTTAEDAAQARKDVAKAHATGAPFDMDAWLTGFAPRRYLDSAEAYRSAKKEAGELAAKLLAADPGTEGGRLRRAVGWSMSECRDVILGAYQARGESTLRPYFSCRHPSCPACELARSRRMAAAFGDGWRDHLKKDGGAWYFATLTIGSPVSPECAPAAVRQLRSQFAALRRRVAWQRCVLGCLTSVQVSPSPSSPVADPRWHIHAHLLLHVAPFADEKDVRSVFDSWQGRIQLDALTRPCVSYFVQDARGTITLTPPPLDAKKQTGAHVQRVAAYLLRSSMADAPADLHPALAEVLARCARLARFCCWGTLAGILRREGRFAPPPDPEPDDGEDEDELADEEERLPAADYPFGVAFRWAPPQGRYFSVVKDHPPSPLQRALEVLAEVRDSLLSVPSSVSSYEDKYLVLQGKDSTDPLSIRLALRTYDPKGRIWLRRLHAHFLLASAKQDVSRYSHALAAQPEPPFVALPPDAAASLVDAQARRLAPLHEKLSAAQRRVAHAEKLLFRSIAACEAAEKLWKKEREDKATKAIPALASVLAALHSKRQAQMDEAAEKERLHELALRWEDRVIPRQADEPIYYQMCRLVLLDVADQHLRGRPSSVHFPVPYCALHRMADAFHSLPPGVQSFFASRRAFGRGVKTWLNGRMKGAYAGFGAKYWKRWSAEARKDQLAAQGKAAARHGQRSLFG